MSRFYNTKSGTVVNLGDEIYVASLKIIKFAA
ncbi:hypothetical protein ABIB62_004182 [Mucilaginibacter sp. UYP25]